MIELVGQEGGPRAAGAAEGSGPADAGAVADGAPLIDVGNSAEPDEHDLAVSKPDEEREGV